MNAKAVRITLAACALALVAPVVGAGEKKDRPNPLIGVVQIQKIFDEYAYAEDMEDTIKGEAEQAQKEINDIKNQMKEKMDSLKHDPMIKPGGTQWKLGMLEIERMKVMLDDKQAKFRKDFDKRRAEFYRTIYGHFRKAVDIYAKYHKYDLIITAPNPELSPESEKADSPSAIQNEILLRRVQYIGATTDVSGPILQLMNDRYEKWKKNGRQGSLD